MAGRSAGLIASIIVARMLGKESFGEFSIIQSTILTFGVFAGFGASLTATKHIAETYRLDPLRSGRILAMSILMACLFGGVMTVLLLLGSPMIATRMLSSPALTPYLQIGSLGLAASSLSGTLNGALAGFEEFKGLSRVNIYSGVATIILMAAGVVYGGMAGALWGYNIAIAVSCYLGVRALQSVAAAKKVTVDFRDCMRERLVLLKFSLPTMLSNTLVIPTSWVCNVMLVNQPNGFSEMAVYNVATQWRQLLLFLPGIAAQVFLPIMSSQAKGEGPGSVRVQFQKINMLIAALFLFGLAALSPFILAFYGATYTAQWPVFVVVQMATFAQIIQAPVITSWAADDRMWTNLFANGFWGVSLVLCSWALIGLGALGLGLALLASFLIYFIVIRAVEAAEGPHGRHSE
jgi:O-antigen/teichoic acid export membrane protein